jgi:hypothetical protein
MKSLSLLLLAGLLLSAPRTVAAQDDEFIEQIIAQLEAATTTFVEAGYEALVWEGGALADDGTENYTVTLTEGHTYVLVGVCDSDCSDLDLTLLDGAGEFVVEDTEVDDAPVIEFTVTKSGEFTLPVTMFECSADFCYFGLALFAE